MVGQKPAQLRISHLGETGAGEHYDVQMSQLPAVMPKAVSDYALYSVAAYRPGNLFARDRHAEACTTQAIGAGKNAYFLAAESQRLCEYPLELSRPGEPEETGKTRSRGGGGPRVVTQALSLLRPLARRFLMIRRPAFVAMRARNP